jgi:LPXTG-site transpeptidase (sortase) family protein
MTKLKRVLQNKWTAYFLIAIGIIGIGLSIHLYLNQPKPPKQTSVKSVSVNAAPSSVKLTPKVIANYTVPASNPRYIAIPAIGIGNTPILKLGLLSSGAMETPDNIYETGWYDRSALPGAKGAMFIYGHVSSWTADGIFFNLKKLKAGNNVTITRGDNTTLTYRVVSIKIYLYDKVDMNKVLAPIDPDKPGLNIMTCTGKIITGTSEFNERLVVFTELVR